MPPKLHLDHAVVNSFLRGLRYPLSKGDLIRLAKANDETGEYLTAFERLPEHSYASQQQVMDEMKRQGDSID